MSSEIITRTSAAGKQLNDWLKNARQNDDILADAQDLLAVLADYHTLMTPGYYVCRALQRHCLELLDGLNCPDLNKPENAGGWPTRICRAVGEKLDDPKTGFGPLHDRCNRWETVLERGYTSSPIGFKSEVYKIATLLNLSDEEIGQMFLLYNQVWSPHNVLDVAFFALRQHYIDNLTWADVMEVVCGFLRETNGTRSAAADSDSVGTQTILGSVKALAGSDESKAGDSVFKAKLVDELVKNAAGFDPVVLADADSDDKLSGCIRPSIEYSRTAALALKGLLRALTILYPGIPPYAVKDGLPEELGRLFSEMFAYVGGLSEYHAPNHATLEETIHGYLNKRMNSLQNDVSETLKALTHETPESVIDHDAVLLLGWFLILGIRFNTSAAEKLFAFESEEEEKPDADLFSKKSGKLLREIKALDESTSPDEQLSHAKSIFNYLLGIFEEAGLVSMGSIYWPRMMDRLVVATTLYPPTPDSIDHSMDLSEYFIHPSMLKSEN